jgi:tRNA (cmo5U34)-methyltransferase
MAARAGLLDPMERGAMGVANHLRIELDEYDVRIRTFVPHYDTLLAVAAGALELVDVTAPTVVDLGVGTGALAAACLRVRPRARLIGLDVDRGMLDAARDRLGATPGRHRAGERRPARGGPSIALREADFVLHRLPRADAMVACVALHHIRDPETKASFYGRVFRALRPGGVLVSADCFPAVQPRLAVRQREAWLAHMQQTYTRSEAEAYLQSWSGEDVYFPLELELGWLSQAGFATEVLWRADGFAVVCAFRTG